MNETNVLGLIAGQGRLPFIVADGAKKAGLKVICTGLGDNPETELASCVDVFITVPMARPGTWIKKLRSHGASKTVMVGRVAKTNIYTPWRILRYLPDLLALKIWYWQLRKKDKQNDTLLCALADELAKGVDLLLIGDMIYKHQKLFPALLGWLLIPGILFGLLYIFLSGGIIGRICAQDE